MHIRPQTPAATATTTDIVCVTKITEKEALPLFIQSMGVKNNVSELEIGEVK